MLGYEVKECFVEVAGMKPFNFAEGWWNLRLS